MRTSRHVIYWSVSRLIAGLSDQFLLFVIPILVYRKTENISLSGAAYIIEWIPRLVSPLLSGVLVDTFCSRKVAVISDSLRGMLCLIAYGMFAFFPGAPFWIYAAVAGAIGLFYEMSFLAFDVSLTRTTATQDLPKIQSGIQSVEQLAFILGPGLAVVVAAHFSLQVIFLIASGLFFFAAGMTALTDKVGSLQKMGSLGKAIHSMRGGYRQITGNRLLLGVTLICFLQNMAMGFCLSLSPGYLQTHLGMKESAFGMLVMMVGIASLILFLALPRILKVTGIWPLFAVTVVLSPISLALMGFSTHHIPYFLGFALLVVVDGCLSIVLRTIRATIVPAENLGAVISAMIFFLNVAFPLGGALLSLSIPHMGGNYLLLSLAVLCGVGQVFLLRSLQSPFQKLNWGQA